MMSWITTFTTLLFVACLYVTSGSVVYVSPLGDDTRNGTLGFPVLTFSAAMGLTSLSERSAIYFDTGAYYNMNIELVNLGNISLTLSAGNGTTKPVFYKHDTMYLNKISGQYNTLLIYNTSGVTIDGIIFQVKDDKYIIGLGSLLYINSSNNVLIQNCELLGNLATTGSGAYIVHSKNITMINNLIANNEAVRRDSALESIFLNSVGSHFNMTSGFMSGNIPFFISQKDILTVGIGGGMYTVESSITVLATIFRNNSATFGGALVLSTNSAFTTRGCLFDSNVAIKQGSVIYSNDIDLEHSVDLTNCMFVNNICRIWSCKLIYAEIWQNQYNKKIADFSPYFTLVVDIIILCLVGLILLSGAAQFLCIFTKYRLAKKKNGRVTPVSTNGNSTEQLGATPTTPVIDTPLGKTDPLVKTEKEVPAIVGTPQDDTSKPTVSLDPKPTPDAPKKEISDEDVSSEEEEEQQEEDIPAGNSAILNTISTAVDTAADWITTGYITPVLDSGLLSIYFQWLFSLSGLTYPIQINKVWRAGHSLFFGFVLTLTALKAFTTSFGIPSFFYDVFDYINIGFGAAECLLLYLMPVSNVPFSLIS
jgi:predicted outer membrane repeat protein